MKKILVLFILVLSMAVSLVSCSSTKYNDALNLIEEGKYADAYVILNELGDYKDAKELLAKGAIEVSAIVVCANFIKEHSHDK